MREKSLFLLFSFIILTVFAQVPPDTVWHPVEPSEIPQPEYLIPYNDVAHNIDVTRISDAAVFGFPDGVGELRAPYSKTQAWNMDMTKIAIGFGSILNADDYSFYKTLNNAIPANGFNDGKWSHLDADIRYLCNNNNFYKINIETEQLDLLYTFAVEEARIGPFEGNISANDKYVVITDHIGFQAYLYDIELNIIISEKTFDNNGFDWATITPWSDYIAVSNNNTGVVELYDLDFNFLRNLSNNQQHADFGIDSFGNEVLVQVTPLSMTRLDNGEVTDLIDEALVCGNYTFDPSIAGHISCRNFDFPGWALVSTPNSEPCTNGIGFYTITEIFAIKLDGSGTIRHYGYSYSDYINYEGEAAASFSPDGTKVIFSSSWNLFGTNDDNTLAYIAEYKNPLLIDDNTIDLFNIYPNPTDGFVNFQTNTDKISFIEIYTILGNKVKTAVISNENNINISSLNNGIYFLKINLSDGNYQIKKIVKN